MVLSKRLLILVLFEVFFGHPLLCQILLREDFSSGANRRPPSGWSNVLVDGEDPDDLWTFDDPYVIEPLASESGGVFATFPGFFYSENGNPERAALISPWVKTSDKTKQVNMSFYQYYFISESHGGLAVSVRKNAISDWQKVTGSVRGESSQLPEQVILNLTSVVGSADSLQIKFEGYGDGGLAWVIDDVTVAQGTLEAIKVDHTLKSNTCSLSYLVEATSPDIQRIGKAWVNYSINGVQQQPVNMHIGTALSVTLTITKPAIIDYQIFVEDNSPNKNRGYSPVLLDKRHRVIVGGTPTSAIGQYWERAEGMYTISEHPIADYFESSRMSFPFYFMDSTYQAIKIMTYPLQVESGYDYLIFQRAYSGYRNVSDTLRWYLSSDGGKSWGSPLYNAAGDRLRTVPPQLGLFSPILDTDWVTDGFTVLPWVNQCIQLRIQAAPGYGNNLYLDHLRFTGTPDLHLSIQDVYPNPASQVLHVVAFIPPTCPARLKLVKMTGQTVFDMAINEPRGLFSTSIDVRSIQSGIYALALYADGRVKTTLVMIL